MYFYVPMSPDGSRRRVLYALLNPFRIDRWLLALSSGQKTISVPMRAFPDKPSDVHRIVNLALEARKQGKAQGGFADVFDNLKSINLYSTQKLEDDQPTIYNLDETDFVVTATTTSGLTLPVDIDMTVFPTGFQSSPLGMPITCGSVTYNDVTLLRLNKTETHLTLSPGLQLRLTEGDDTKSAGFDLTSTGKLRSQLKDFSFFLNVVEGMTVEVNGRPLFSSPIASPDKDDLGEIRTLLEKMVAVLDYVGLRNSAVEPAVIDGESKSSLLRLHQAFVLGNEVEMSTDGFGRLNIDIGSMKVLALVTEGSDSNHRRVSDLLHPQHRDLFRIRQRATDDPSVMRRVTAYELLSVEDYGSTLNLHLEEIVGAYEALDDRALAVTLANQTLLNLLSAADIAVGDFRVNLLTGADRLGEWLAQVGGGGVIYEINRWQTRLRLGVLNLGDRQSIRATRRSILRDVESDVGLKYACLNILLGDREELSSVLEELSPADRETLEGWPIWHLAANMDSGAEGDHGAVYQ